MISQFFILSPQRGDILIFRELRHDTPRDAPDLLLDRLKTWQKDNGTEQDPPPIFNVDGVNFLFTNEQGLYFVCTTKFNVSPFMIYELLGRIATLIKDFCGILSEESLRLNSSLVYELLDEIIDYGYVQTTSTDQLKSYVYEDPIPVKRENIIINSLAKLKAPGTNLGSSSNRPITHSRDERSSEVFIDMIERLVASFAPNGMTAQAEIDGSIQIKSYLQGNPEIRLALNSNIVFGRDKDMSSDKYGIMFDDYKFHDSVDPSDFDEHKRMIIYPPEGETTIMNYRISGDISLPFRVFPTILHVPRCPNRMDVTIKIRADIPEDRFANKCTLTVPLPRITQSVSKENMDGSDNQSFQYDDQIKNAIWTVNNLRGGTAQLIKIKITGATSFSAAADLEVGPIILEFDIPNYTCSNIQIRRLKVYEKNKSIPPQRWIRYFTISESYVCRV
ncbi:Mu homology domain-containing protein [Glomus cerebriforme]|uniref:Mu homology domain-containing protein n=1 Tax=Glomus cerebriforme TaxID=658196 RepID=A0A397S876_9GLOM|nr:Mu homology domain-containing protein [Glomus cerebriforme]